MRSIEKAPTIKTLSKNDWATIEQQRDLPGTCADKGAQVEDWYIDRVNMSPERLDEKRALCAGCPRTWFCLAEAVQNVDEDRVDDKGYGYLRAGVAPRERLAARAVIESMIAAEHPSVNVPASDVNGAVFLRLTGVANLDTPVQ